MTIDGEWLKSAVTPGRCCAIRAVLAAGLAAGLLAVGACSTMPPSATTTAPATPPGQLPDSLPGLTGYGDECPGANTPQVYNGAAPYQGRGPHPVAFVDPGDSTVDNNFYTDDSNPNNTVPDGTFSTEPHDWIPPTVSSVQLVACVVDNWQNLSNPPTARDCGMYQPQGGGFPFDVQIIYDSYTITLVNAKTGKQVAPPVTIVGKQIPNCPPKVSYSLLPSAQFYTILSTAQAESAFGRYINVTV